MPSFFFRFVVAAGGQQAQHEQQQEADAGEDLIAHGPAHKGDGTGGDQIAHIADIIEHIGAEIDAHHQTAGAQQHIERGADGLVDAQNLAVDGAGGGLIAIAQIEQQRGRGHDNAALEAAAGADGAKQDHINAEHNGEGEQSVCAALQDDVLFLDSAFQFH